MALIIFIVLATLVIGVSIYVLSTNSKDGVIIGDKSVDIMMDVSSDSLNSSGHYNFKKPGIFISKESFLKLKKNPNNLKSVIQMAIADGVLTIDERERIKYTAISAGFDHVKVLDEVEKHVRFLEIDSDTKLVDLHEKNRVDFERLVVHKFCKVLFKIKEWPGEKYVHGEYSDNSPTPDLLVEFIAFNKNIEFGVKYAWRQRTIKNGIEFSTYEQLNQFREYEKERKVPFFIILGLEGKGAAPERLFIVPLKVITKPFMLLIQLNKYEKKVGANFYFDYVKKQLK